jgi:hypothetical protein
VDWDKAIEFPDFVRQFILLLYVAIVKYVKHSFESEGIEIEMFVVVGNT